MTLFAVLTLAALVAQQPKMDMQKLDELVKIRQSIEAVQFLDKEKFSVNKDALTQEALDRAKTNVGESVTYEQIVKLTGGDARSQTAWEKAKGFLTFVNLIYITAAFMLVAACIWLFHLYLVGLVLMIPKEAWEWLLYAGCAVTIALGRQLNPDFQMLLVLPGCLGLVGCLQFSGWVHKTVNPQAACWFLTAIWGLTAILYGSHLIGFLTVGAFLGALGFVCGMFPGVVWIGFDEEDVVPRTTIAAGLLMALYSLMSITGTTNEHYAVFREGLAFMGTFVYFLGLLIWSSKWFRSSYYIGTEYWVMQGVTVASGVIILWLGSIYGLNFLLGISGTFFYLYMLQKYYEIPWRGKGWAWSLLGLSGILYLFAIFAKMYPQYFLFMIW